MPSPPGQHPAYQGNREVPLTCRRAPLQPMVLPPRTFPTLTAWVPDNPVIHPVCPSTTASHPMCDAGALVISDDITIPDSTSVNTNRALQSHSVCILPASQMKDYSHAGFAPYRSHFKDSLHGVNTRKITNTEATSVSSNSVSITPATCKHDDVNLASPRDHFKAPLCLLY